MSSVLELGKAGTAGTERGVRPVLRDGAVVATLRASNWRESATAEIGGQSWVFTRDGRQIVARWSAEPEGAVRMSAQQVSWWKGAWALDLEGTAVDMEVASYWRGTHRYLVAGRSVAESGTTGGWSGRPTLTSDGALPLPHQVFLLWLEVVLQRRAAAAAAA
jgi:hypothetical protein